MRKSIISLTIDPEVWELSKQKYPQQLSGIIEDYLRIITYSNSIVDVDKLKEEKIQALEHISQNKEKLMQIQALQRQQDAEEKEKIKLNRNQQIEKNKCVNCNNFLGIKKIKINKGLICNSCLYNATNKQIREWGFKNG